MQVVVIWRNGTYANSPISSSLIPLIPISLTWLSKHIIDFTCLRHHPIDLAALLCQHPKFDGSITPAIDLTGVLNQTH